MILFGLLTIAIASCACCFSMCLISYEHDWMSGRILGLTLQQFKNWCGVPGAMPVYAPQLLPALIIYLSGHDPVGPARHTFLVC